MSQDKELDLEIVQNERFAKRERFVVRVGWVVLTLLIVAGVVGLLGVGPLSWSTSSSDTGNVRVEYQRVAHHEADDSITLHVAEQTVRDGKITVELTGEWVSGVDLSGITPQPASQLAVPGGVAMEFDVARVGDIEVAMTFRAQKYGPLDADVSVGAESLSFTQVVLP